MKWFDDRKQDIEAAIVGAVIGWEAHKQDMEDLDWQNTLDFVCDQGVDPLDREHILDKAIDVGYLARHQVRGD